MDFTMGQNLKYLKLTFVAEKSTNIILEYTKRCGIETFRGVCFLRKNHFFEKILILDFLDNNGASLYFPLKTKYAGALSLILKFLDSVLLV